MVHVVPLEISLADTVATNLRKSNHEVHHSKHYSKFCPPPVYNYGIHVQVSHPLAFYSYANADYAGQAFLYHLFIVTVKVCKYTAKNDDTQTAVTTHMK